MIIDRNAVTQEVPIDPETGKPYLNTVAAIQVSANGVGSEVSPYVAQAVEVIRESGLPQETNALFTNVEGDLDDVLKVAGEAAKKLAERKAGAVVQEVLAQNYTGMLIVIGADTMVVLDGKIFGKPRSLSDAKHMLRQLSGRTHEVITAVSVWMIAAPAAEDISLGFRTFADTSRVTFRDLTDEEIADYLARGESFDKAGAYAIQGEGAKLVDHYDGSLDTIIGLPAERLIKEFPDLVNAEAAEC